MLKRLAVFTVDNESKYITSFQLHYLLLILTVPK
jgi:hypothetical protein